MSERIVKPASAIFILLLLILQAPEMLADEGGDRQLLDIVSRKLKAPVHQLRILTEASVEYPLVGRKIRHAKLLNKDTGGIVGIAIDEQFQEEVDSELVLAQERALYREKWGKLGPSLHDYLQQLDTDEAVRVVISVGAESSTPYLPSLHSMIQEQADSFLADAARNTSVVVEDALEPVLYDLYRRGFEPLFVGKYSPIVVVKLPASEIYHLAGFDEVQHIGRLIEGIQPHLNSAAAASHIPTVWDLGLRGSGVRIGVIEASAGRLPTHHPYLGTIPTVDSYSGVPPSGLLQDTNSLCSHTGVHATTVVGIVKSTHEKFTGIGMVP